MESGHGTSVVGSETSHRCGLSCLSPLTFHPAVVGDEIRLSHEGRFAERTAVTFKNGLVFSSRPVKVQERIFLRIEKDLLNWEGAMRLGFTNVPPLQRSLPLPPMAIPNITNDRGNWAAALDRSHCQVGSQLEVWLTHGGSVRIRSSNFQQHKLLRGVDLSRPLWAMIDIYGQTCAVSLLGSEKKQLFRTRRSCPAPEEVPAAVGGATSCVVCMEKQPQITLPCGHQCLCEDCAFRVLHQFGTCPLCRHEIDTRSALHRRGVLSAPRHWPSNTKCKRPSAENRHPGTFATCHSTFCE
ncbi:E3 ubiquitin-protein ligase NEURL3 [Spinachia spinachia]